jgi:hypothetical protein
VIEKIYLLDYGKCLTVPSDIIAVDELEIQKPEKREYKVFPSETTNNGARLMQKNSFWVGICCIYVYSD